MTHFSIRKDDNSYIAICETEFDPMPALFSGTGSSLAEALGKCIISNREVLNITFDFKREDGVIERSTIYGQPRPL